MALYRVSRTDDVQPGEFVDAYVIAGGTAQARNAVSHMDGVTKKNVLAQRMDTAAGVQVLSTYFDERETAPEAPTDGFGY
jgi:protein involved in sex pheromone biosynthesis